MEDPGKYQGVLYQLSVKSHYDDTIILYCCYSVVQINDTKKVVIKNMFFSKRKTIHNNYV